MGSILGTVLEDTEDTAYLVLPIRYSLEPCIEVQGDSGGNRVGFIIIFFLPLSGCFTLAEGILAASAG